MCPAARQGKECPLGNACPKVRGPASPHAANPCVQPAARRARGWGSVYLSSYTHPPLGSQEHPPGAPLATHAARTRRFFDTSPKAARPCGAPRQSHNAFELWLHPDKFKTRLCSKGTQCPRKVRLPAPCPPRQCPMRAAVPPKPAPLRAAPPPERPPHAPALRMHCGVGRARGAARRGLRCQPCSVPALVVAGSCEIVPDPDPLTIRRHPAFQVCFFAHTQEELRHPPPAHSHPAALAAAQDDSGSGAGAPAPWAPRPAASAEAGAAAGGGRCAVGGPGAATSYVALGAAEAAALRAACATGAFASALAPEHSPLGSLPRPPGRRPPCEPGPPAAPAAWAALLPGEPLQQLLAASAEMAGPGISGGGAGGLPARCAEELAMQQLLQRAALQRQQAQMQEQHGWDELQQERLRRVRMQQTQLGAASSSPAASSSRGQHELRGLQEQQAQQQQAEALLLQAMIESRAAAATQQAAGAASGAAGCAPVVAPTMAAPAAGGWPQAAASAASPVPVAREAAQQLAGCMPLGASSCALNAEAGLLMSPAAFPPGGVPVVAAIPTPPFSPAPAAAPCGWPAAAAPPFSPAAVAAPGSVLSAGGHGTLVVWGVPPSAILNPQNQVSPAAAQQGQWQLGAGCHTNGWPLGR